jgi:GT2 family glycosyltransferase
MYFEDVDFCLRIKKLGFNIAFFPNSEIIHFGGKSIKIPKQRKKIYFESEKYFYQKHYGSVKLFLLKILRYPFGALAEPS